jgi:hypothetical protein
MSSPSHDLTCRSAVDLIGDLVENALSPEQRVDIELHMITCAGCMAMLRRYRETIAVLGALSASVPSGALKARVLAAAEADLAGRRGQP